MARWSTRFVLAVWLLAPAPAFAQATAGSIAGTVRDTTGGVLPGATVEASSPVHQNSSRAPKRLSKEAVL
jgi:hypothetical protein